MHVPSYSFSWRIIAFVIVCSCMIFLMATLDCPSHCHVPSLKAMGIRGNKYWKLKKRRQRLWKRNKLKPSSLLVWRKWQYPCVFGSHGRNQFVNIVLLDFALWREAKQCATILLAIAWFVGGKYSIACVVCSICSA